MVKSISQEIKPTAKLENCIELGQTNSFTESDPSTGELQEIIPSPSIDLQKEEKSRKKKPPIQFENTAVGCLIHFLRKKSPSSLEEIVQHVKRVEHNLVTCLGKKFTKDAFKIADYAISWNPKLFLLDRHFNYYLNEEKAKEVEGKFSKRDERIAQQLKESKERCKKRLERQAERRKSWNRIRKIILNDLSGEVEEASYLTKAFIILTSDNKEQASSLTKEIRMAYASMIKNSVKNS